MTKQIIDASEIARQQNYIEQIGLCQADYRSGTGFSRRYFIQTYGCQLNENDSEQLAGQLDLMGYTPAEELREADLIVLNTCSVRENADDRLFGNLGIIKNLRRDKPDLIIALCGCMMKQTEHVEKIRRSYSFVDIIFGPQDIYRLPELLYHRLTDRRRVYEVGAEDTVVEGLPVHRARKFRALISIMFGCNNFCTYCIVPYTRGRERSRHPEAILAEVKQLAESGYKEVLLLGQNVNSYGQDLKIKGNMPTDFAELLTAIAELGGLKRIRFMTSHPKDLSDKVLEAMAGCPAIEPHLHLPLQSGSDRILKLMNRHYTRDQYLTIVRKARQMIPGLAITTDLIVGFPGETEEDFAETLSLMSEVQFDSAFTFQYSKRNGTPAAEMDEQISAEVVRERFGRLVDLQNKHSLASNEKIIGQSVEVLIEGISESAPGILTGRTASSKLINFTVPFMDMLPENFRLADGTPDGEALEGRLALVRLLRAKTFSIEGEMEQLLP